MRECSETLPQSAERIQCFVNAEINKRSQYGNAGLTGQMQTPEGKSIVAIAERMNTELQQLQKVNESLTGQLMQATLRAEQANARISNHKFNVGDHVDKVSGYTFPGVVVAVFWTQQGQLRYVVQMKHHNLLHIFNEGQLRYTDLNLT